MSEEFARATYTINMPALISQVIGRVGKTPEVRETKTGKSVATVAIVASQRYLNQTTETWEENTCWYNTEVWGDAAKRIGEMGMVKGDIVLATFNTAKLRTEGYVDRDGKNAASLKVSADSIKRMAQKVGANDVPVNEDAISSSVTDEEIPF